MTHSEDLEQSWIANAANWTRAVRERTIPSRKAGTDRAIVDAIVTRQPKRVLDVGCGEGWLCRRLRMLTACETTGIDFSPDLSRDALRTDPGGRYLMLSYADLVAGRHELGGFDVVAFNYALFEEDLVPLLSSARGLLAPGGAIVIQTLHPDAFCGEQREGWRVEDFAAFQSRDWTPMPWYFRSVASWRATIAQAGLAVAETREPKAQPNGQPLSLLMICEPAP